MRDRPNDQHRTRVEQKLGRSLGPDEIVHHANEDKQDNSDANLNVQGRGPHTAQHNRQRGLSRLRTSLRMVKEGKRLY